MNESTLLAPHLKFKPSKNVFCSDVDREKVILNLKTGAYYGLEELGARIWDLLQQSKTFIEIRDIVTREYQVETEECERDLQELLQELLDAELIEVADEQST
jgi:hypothetical protein